MQTTSSQPTPAKTQSRKWSQAGSTPTHIQQQARRALRLLLSCAAVLMLLATPHAHAQLSTATMFGNVTDSSGGAIPNATVVLTQTQTNFARHTTTNGQGEYRAEFLPIGPYSVKVTATGFKETVRNGLVLNGSQEAEVNLNLEPGGVNTVVEVTAEVPLVNLGNSTLSGTLDNHQVDNLPLVNRDVYQLANIVPGVQNLSEDNSVGFPETHLIINGSSDDLVGQITYYLDGGLNMTGLRNTGNALPNPDAIDQFNIQTSNFSAVYGRTGAGVLSVLTKSGTNQVHGSVFEFHQETNFNSDSYLQHTRTPEHINRFGATAGGPAIKNKIFFFGSYAGLRQVAPVDFNTVVPDALQRLGNFSENLPTTTPASGLGACATTLNAADKANTNYGGKFFVCDPVTHQPIAGNRADLDPNYMALIDPVAAAVLAKNVPLPSPNQATPANRYIGNEGLPNQTDEFLIKGDLQFIPKHRIALDYFQSNGKDATLPSGSNLPNWALNDYVYRQQNANVSDVWTISNRTVNQVWLNFTRMAAGRVSTPGISLAAYGSDINVQGTPSLSDINVSGFFHLANAISGPEAGDNQYGLRDLYSTTRGRHTLSLGGEIYLEKDVLETLLNNYGTFSFTSSTVPNTASGQSTYVKTGAAISDLLIGRPNTMGQDSPDDGNSNYFNYGFFAQDDWRITPALTLNLGVRYDVQTAPVDTQHRTAIFQPGTQSTVSPLAIPGQLFPGDPGVPAGGTGTNYNHVSPRLGFAYDPFNNGKTVVHGGAGLFFDSVSGNEAVLPQNFQPFAVRETNAFTHVLSLANIYSTDPQDFAGGVSPFPFVYSPTNPRYVSPAQLVFIQKGMRWPYNTQVNFGIQQQLARELVLSINYVGAFSRKLPLYIDNNAPIYNTTNPKANTTSDYNCRRPYDALPFAAGSTTTCASPALGSKYYANAYVITDSQTSNFNAMQVILDKRLSHQFSVNAYYVWSKSLASASIQTAGNIGNSAATEPEDYYDLSLERQRTDNDVRQQFTANAVWKPIFFHQNHLLHAVLDGWSVAAIVQLHSGKPFLITSGTDDNDDGDTNDRPNIIPGQFARLVPYSRSVLTASTQKWFNTAAYCRVTSAGCPVGGGPAGVDGLVRVNSLSSPGYRDVDASLFRDFGIYGRVKFQFRGEATNVFNLVSLGAPGGTFNASSFGTITGASAMRVIQVGGRLLW
ncbi:MAG: TonB-dependent receptor [Acidobacteriaceae bacterium]